MASATTSNWLYTEYINWMFRDGTPAFKPTGNVYLALFTNQADPAGGGTEVPINASTNYARVAVPLGASAWSAPSGTNLEISNAADIVFPVPGVTSWGNIQSSVIFNAATGGNMLYIGNIVTAKPVSSGDGAPRVLVGQCKISRASC